MSLSKFPVGSSANITGESVTSVLAMATRCCCPPDNCNTFLLIQIDTGYVAQHIASLVTQISGQAMRGKGLDLIDASEIKAANFLDSLDKKGATAPRWNFTAVTKEIMERFLDYENIYLLSMDLNAYGRFRTRMWKIDITKHLVLRERYIEWMNKLGYPKFNTTSDQPSVNFQFFPPHSGTEESFARHGNGRSNGFSKLEIQLENCEGAELVFRADENEQGIIVISKFKKNYVLLILF